MLTPMTTGPLTIHIGHDELIIRKRYEVLSIVNDILVALWFIVGSILFFSDATTIAGTWCFLAGSIELLIRPLIRLSRRVHLTRIAGPAAAVETSQDF
jgi:YrhK-like protein